MSVRADFAVQTLGSAMMGGLRPNVWYRLHLEVREEQAGSVYCTVAQATVTSPRTTTRAVWVGEVLLISCRVRGWGCGAQVHERMALLNVNGETLLKVRTTALACACAGLAGYCWILIQQSDQTLSLPGGSIRPPSQRSHRAPTLLRWLMLLARSLAGRKSSSTRAT